MRKRLLVTGGSGFIGTNLVSALRGRFDLLNIDIAPPRDADQTGIWVDCDIREQDKLGGIVASFRPDYVVHLAARTDLGGVDLDAYSSNTIGTESLVRSLSESSFRGRVVFASSMYVCEPGYIPMSWDDLRPHTPYGQSKVVSERIVRESKVEFSWTIVRPTSIWGPWFGEPYDRFFDMVLRKRYFHMRAGSCEKTFGYVENTVAQIASILDAPAETVAGRMYYLGDHPAYDIDEWASEIASCVPYEIPTYPFFLFRAAAFCGDLLSIAGVSSPLTSFRLKNMRTDNVHDVQSVLGLVADPPVTRKVGIERTVRWIRSRGVSVRSIESLR